MNIAQAKQIAVEDVLRHYGHEPVRRVRDDIWYCSPFRMENVPSFKVFEPGNVWYDHGEGEGGGIIELMQRLLATDSVRDCLEELARLNSGASVEKSRVVARAQSMPKRDEEPSGMEVGRIGVLENRALTGYLKKRGISKRVAERYVQEIHYSHGGKQYFALTFPNDAGGYELRNPYYQGTFGRKAISTIWPENTYDRDQETVAPAVFEGFSDFLSALEYYGVEASRQPVIIMNSASMREQAVEAIQGMGASKIYLYCDNDKTGKELAAYFHEQLPNVEVLDKSDLYEGYKDFNQFLVGMNTKARAA